MTRLTAICGSITESASGQGEVPPFTGGRFEFLDGGGDRTDVCNRFTTSDILALELLSVQLPPRAALDLLEGGTGGRGSSAPRENSALCAAVG
jgi:Family of unknown function (DUF6308)